MQRPSPRRRREAPAKRTPAATADIGTPAPDRAKPLHIGLATAALAAVLLVLHGRFLRWPFVSDDFVFLEASRSVRQLFSSFDVYSNYFRPIGRELYFLIGRTLAGNHPLPYHLFNFLLLVGIVAMVVGLGRRLGGARVGWLAGAAYALLYSHRLTLAWVSCSQDLLATCLALGSAHAMLSGHRKRAGFWHLGAMLAKESVAAFPLVFAMWRAWDPRSGAAWSQRVTTAMRETASLWGATAAWAAIVLAVRVARNAWAHGQGTALADVSLSAGSLWEGMRSALLSYVALEQPWDAIGRAFAPTGWPWIALGVTLALLGALVWASFRAGTSRPAALALHDRTLALGILWAVLGAVPIALAGHHFSAYYITFAGVGFALAVGRLLGAARPTIAFAVLAAQAVLGIAANRVDLFNFSRLEPEAGVSFITMTRLDHERVYLDSLHVALARVQPARGSAVYTSHAPRYSTFVTMYGRAPRVWFDDPGFDLPMIGEYHSPEPRPHAFLRFVPATRGFVQVPNAVMDADLAAETAMLAANPAGALAELDRALALLPAAGPRVVELDLLNNRGSALQALGDTAATRVAWRRALALDPGFVSAAIHLARLDASASRMSSARETLERVLAHAPEDPDALDLLARIQLVQGDGTAARVTLARLAEVDPVRARALQPTPGASPGP